jgi:hypothetical protein
VLVPCVPAMRSNNSLSVTPVESVLRDGIKCNRNNGRDKEEHHHNRNPKDNVVEITTHDPTCVKYTLGFGIQAESNIYPIVGAIKATGICVWVSRGRWSGSGRRFRFFGE